jgi:hypothetical protein
MLKMSKSTYINVDIVTPSYINDPALCTAHGRWLVIANACVVKWLRRLGCVRFGEGTYINLDTNNLIFDIMSIDIMDFSQKRM